MRKLILLLFIVVLSIGCQNNEEFFGNSEYYKIQDSILIKNEILKDSVLFNSLYTQALSHFKLNIGETTIYKNQNLEIKRFYYKNKHRLFNYFLFETQDTSFAIQFNFIYNFEKIFELNKNANDASSKKTIAFLKKRVTLSSDLNKINNLLYNKKSPLFKEIINLLIKNSEKIKIIDSLNFNQYFDDKKYIGLGCQKQTVDQYKNKIRHAIEEPETTVAYSSNVFVVIKLKDEKLVTDFYFENLAFNWSL